MTGKVRGVGGVFIRSERPKELAAWYQRHLGFPLEEEGGAAVFHWSEADAPVPGSTTWAILDDKSKLLSSPDVKFMVNYCVDDLAALVEKLRGENVTIEMEPQTNVYGCFAWIRDLEGRRIELWEPPAVYPPPSETVAG